MKIYNDILNRCEWLKRGWCRCRLIKDGDGYRLITISKQAQLGNHGHQAE